MVRCRAIEAYQAVGVRRRFPVSDGVREVEASRVSRFFEGRRSKWRVASPPGAEAWSRSRLYSSTTRYCPLTTWIGLSPRDPSDTEATFPAEWPIGSPDPEPYAVFASRSVAGYRERYAFSRTPIGVNRCASTSRANRATISPMPITPTSPRNAAHSATSHAAA
jgi:hypothetical protein